MKIKKKTYSTVLSELYGRDGYQSHIEVGREYWHWFSENDKVYEETGQHWNKIYVTYIRSGVFFYEISGYQDIPEDWCPVSCFMAANLVFAEINPEKDLKGILSEELIESTKLMYRFDDELTEVKNWPNEHEVEISEENLLKDYPNDYMLIKIMAQIL